ncbi:hypothetical protein [Streptomyces mirabilis]|uniref:hypothetical protein n=1 Tax=Streptomyces mirabilis TaxID=68239 RepID=UPI00224FE3B2|nr:hypothetical protein [Streptomyces mirabilis]MCX4419316.1 hypothetical protein [Streptomyces mirabilis]
MEDVFTLVVGEDAGDDAIPAPVLDRLEVDAEVAGEFGDGQQTLVQESLAVAAQLVGVTQVNDHPAGEGLAHAAGQAPFVKDGRTLGVGVLVEEFVECGDDGGVGLPQFPGGLLNLLVGAIFLAQMSKDRASYHQSKFDRAARTVLVRWPAVAGVGN